MPGMDKITIKLRGKQMRICVNCYNVLRRAGLLKVRPYRKDQAAPESPTKNLDQAGKAG